MSQAGYTPIQLYYSTTTAAVPTNTNLADGELAINITDGKLYYKDNTGTVKLLAGATAGPAGGSNTQVQFNSSGVLTGSANLTFNGTILTAAGFSGPLNGTVGATTPTTGAFTSVTASGNISGDNAILGGDARLPLTGKLSFNGATATDYMVGPSNGTINSYIASSLKTSLTSTGLAVTGALSATKGSAGLVAFFLSGNSAQSPFISFGRAAEDVRIQIAAATNDLFTGTVAGDYATNSNASIWFGTGGNPITKISSTGLAVTGTATSNGYTFNYNTSYWNVDGYLSNYSATNGVYLNGNASGWLHLNADGTQAARIKLYGSSNATPNIIEFTTASTERFRIAASGAFGLSGANYGTSGQVLTSGGSGAAPTWTTVGGGGGSAATPTALGTVYGLTNTGGISFLGYQAGNSNTGSNNTAVGVQALYSNTSASNNVAVGSLAGYAVVSTGGGSNGAANVLLGYKAGYGITTGYRNIAIGSQDPAYSDPAPMMTGPVTGGRNVAIGTRTLVNLTSGDLNLAIGDYSGNAITTGSSNIAIGQGALGANTTSSNSVAIGQGALALANVATSGFGGSTVAIGYQALYNAGTVAGNGTGDCTAVGYRAGYNTSQAGNGAVNTFIGANSGYSNVSGYGNTFIGASAGYGQNSGDQNICIGYSTGRQSVGSGGGKLIAIGNGAGQANSGNDNTFVGVGAGQTNGSSSQNAYFGTYAGLSATGGNNVALGFSAMYSTTSAANNVAVGSEALRSMTSASGSHVAVGYQALYSATDNSNTAVGYRSGYGVTSGHNNTLLGINAGNGSVVLAGGALNVVIGAGAYTNTTGAYQEIVIGAGCNGLGNDRVSIGKLNSRIWAQYDSSGSWTYSSDVRLKKDIEDDSLGLSFINKLRPVKYRWKATNELEQDNPQYNKVNNKNTTVVMHGLIAQEVKAALDEEGVSTFAGWAVEPNGIQSVSREMFITPLINAIQELTAQIETLKAEVAALKGNV